MAQFVIQDSESVAFVRANFNASVCTYFCPPDEPQKKSKEDKNPTEVCQCGLGTKEDHDYDCALEDLQLDVKARTDPKPWSDKYLQKIATNAFGKIHFKTTDTGFRKPAKYVRFTDDCDIGRVLELMLDYWRLGNEHWPELVLSLRGGGKQFYVSSTKRREIFDKGIINAVTTTNGWLLTFGCRFGVARVVGEAVRDAQTIEFDENNRVRRKLECIGICGWRHVRNREYLLNNDKASLNNAPYRVDTRIRPHEPSALDPNHTHFLIVDGGTKSSEVKKTDNFRALLERRIAAKEPFGLGVPVVCVLVEGGTAALEGICESLNCGVPVVVCDDTGRAADIVADVMKQLSLPDISISKDTIVAEVEMKLRAIQAKWRDKDEIAKLGLTVVDCCLRNRQLIKVVNVSKSEDLSVAILGCLMEGKKLDVLSQVTIAQRWNQVKVAKELIDQTRSTKELRSVDLIPCFTEALIREQREFVQVYVDANFRVNRYLTISRLRQLYRDALRGPDMSYLDELLTREVPAYRRRKRENLTAALWLADVHELIRRFTRRFSAKAYADDTMIEENETEFREQPFTELFIFSIVTNRRSLAEYFWEQSEEPLSVAVIGTLLCTSIIERLSDDDFNIKVGFEQLKDRLETLAVNILDASFKSNREKALLVLQKPLKMWSGSNALVLAGMANDMVFLAAECCQLKIFSFWKEGFSASASRIFIATVSLFAAPYLISFNIDKNRQRRAHAKAAETPALARMSIQKGLRLRGALLNQSLKLLTPLATGRSLHMGDKEESQQALVAPQQYVPSEAFETSNGVHNTSFSFDHGTVNLDLVGVSYIDQTPGRATPHHVALNLRTSVPRQNQAETTGFDTPTNASQLLEDSRTRFQQQRSWSVHPKQQMQTAVTVDDVRGRCDCGAFWRKLVIFYTAPATKFTYHTIFYIIFLFLYSYVILFSYRWNMTFAEMCLHVWIFALLSEEFRVIFSFSGNGVLEKIRDWWTFSSLSTFNRIDIVILVAGAIAFGLRWFHSTFEVARLILALNQIMFLTRLLKVYFVNRYLGPKVLMIKRMTWDLVMFLLVLVVFMLAYSIASQALLYPKREFYPRIFWDLFNHGIWELFGELQDEMTGHGSNGSFPSCEMSETSHPFECDVRMWPGPMLLAAYLFFGNILMVNILIAIFSHVFDNVEKHAHEIWKYQMYFLVEEFRRKPLLPAPFVIFFHIWRLLRCVIRMFRPQRDKAPDAPVGATARELELLAVFERVCRAELLSNKRDAEESSMENQIKQIHQRLAELSALVGSKTSDQLGFPAPL